MKKMLFFLTCVILSFVKCNPIEITVPKTETIDVSITSANYVTRTTESGDEDFIQISNSAISIDREIEIYFGPYRVEDYWGMVIDVDILIAPGGGELLICDDDHSYEGKKIRVIITWYEEEEIEFE